MIEKIKAQDEEYLMHTYKKFDVAFSYGKGSTLYDVEGKDYIDFGSGIGTSCLGYNDKKWVKAVTAQSLKYAHCSNLYYNPLMAELAEKLCKTTHMSKVFFGNSGAEANEGAIKLARKYSFDKYGADKKRNIILTLKNSFHGRTVTTLSATGQDVFHNYFFPFTEGFVFSEPKLEHVKKTISENGRICAVMIETIQGEGGVNVLDKTFISELRAFTKECDILLIDDEIQTGVGRTGKFLSAENYDLEPDIVTLAKGLAGGLPIGAVLCSSNLRDVFSYSDHGSTFGGNPMACAGANVVMDTVANEPFLNEVVKKGLYIREKLKKHLGEYITDIRGAGLMLGVDFKENFDVKKIASDSVKNGVLPLTAKTSLRLLPPLVITYEEIDEGIKRMKEIIK